MGIHRSVWQLVGLGVCVLAVSLSTFALAESTIKGQPALQDKSAPGPVQFMDLQWLKPGVSPERAGAYFNDKLAPIVHKHGGDIVFTYQIVGVMRGDVKPAVIAGMEFPSMDAMQGLFKDPEYQKIVPQRDEIFDLSRMSLFQIAPFSGN